MLKCEPCESNLTDFTISDGPHFLFPNSEATEKEYEKRKQRETTQDLGEEWNSNQVIYIKNEPRKRIKHKRNLFRKEESKEHNNLRETDLAVHKMTEGINVEPSKVIPCDIVYHDSYKLLFEDTNIHVEIPYFDVTNYNVGIKAGKNDNKNKTIDNENLNQYKMEDKKQVVLQQIEHLKEYLAKQRSILKGNHQKEFYYSMNIISDVLNYNFFSIGKNRYNSQIPLFQKHDHFLSQIIKEKRFAGEGKIQRVIGEEKIGTKGSVLHETISEIPKKEDLKKKKSPVHGENMESIYNRTLQIRTTCDPGLHPRVLYPPKHKLESIRNLHIPKSSVLFDSKFESGNLHYASKERGSEVYILFLKNDLRSSEKRSQWFFFSASYVPDEYYNEITKGEYTQRNMNEYISEMNRDLSMNQGGVKYSIDISDRLLVKETKKLKKPFTVRFKIVNMTKPYFLYRDGHSPLTFSSCAFANKNKGWTRSAYDIKYVKNTGVKYYNMKKNSYEVLGSSTYTLEFSYDFMYAYDTVYFSSSYPYTYTHLMEQLELIKKSAIEDPGIEYKQELLCRTTCGFECPVLGITNYENTNKRTNQIKEKKEYECLVDFMNQPFSQGINQETFNKEKIKKDSLKKMSMLSNFIKNGTINEGGEIQGKSQKINITSTKGILDTIFQGSLLREPSPAELNKKIIFISARVHPGETNSSYALQGFLYFLVSKNAYAKILRDEYIFVIIPMLNIDGVILGNNRLCPNGFDLNRHWHRPISYLHPTIYAAKMLIKKISKIGPITFFCDFHGHSTKYNSFVFGNWVSSGMKSTYVRGQKLMEVFPRIFSDTLPWYSLKDTKFKVENANRGIARYICGREFKIECSYTLEMSLLGVQMKRGKNEISKLGKDFFENWSKSCKDPEEEKNVSNKSTMEFEFFYFDENMFVMTGVSFGLSLYKFVNFMNYHKLEMYEKTEEKTTTTPQSSMSNQSVPQGKKELEISKEKNGSIKGGMSSRRLKSTVSVSPFRKRRIHKLSKGSNGPLSSSSSFHRGIHQRTSVSKSVHPVEDYALLIKSNAINNEKECIASNKGRGSESVMNKKSSNTQTIPVSERTSLHFLSTNEIIACDSTNMKNEPIPLMAVPLIPESNMSSLSSNNLSSNNKTQVNNKKGVLSSLKRSNESKKYSNERKENLVKNTCKIKEDCFKEKKSLFKRNSSRKNSSVKNDLTASLNPNVNCSFVKTRKKHTGLVQKEIGNDQKKEDLTKEVGCVEPVRESSKEKKKVKKKSTSLKNRKPKEKNEKKKKESEGEIQLATTYLQKLNRKCKSLLWQYSKLNKPHNAKVKTSLVTSGVGQKSIVEKNEKGSTTQRMKQTDLKKKRDELVNECKKLKGSEKWIQLKKKNHGIETQLALITPHSLQQKRIQKRIKLSKRIKLHRSDTSNGVGIPKIEKLETGNNDSDSCAKIKHNYKKKEIQRIKNRRQRKKKGILLNKKFSALMAALKKYTDIQELYDENKISKTSRNPNNLDKDYTSTKRNLSGKKTTRKAVVDEKKKKRRNQMDNTKTKEKKKKKANSKIMNYI